MQSMTQSTIAALLLLAAPVARPQSLLTNWGSFVGGGGTSTAGVYSVMGTIAQPAATKLSSSDFSIDGGFWSIVAAIQEPGAPLLSVRRTQTNTVVISWPLTWPGFVLRESTDLKTTNWVDVATPPSIVVAGENAAEKHVTVPAPAGPRFYRLRKP